MTNDTTLPARRIPVIHDTDRRTLIFDGQSPDKLACDTTLRRMPDGSWVMVMLGGGDFEPLPANQVFLTRSLDEGKTWGSLQPLDLGFSRQGDTSALTPSELMVHGGTCTLSVSSHNGSFAAWKQWLVVSTDSGRNLEPAGHRLRCPGRGADPQRPCDRLDSADRCALDPVEPVPHVSERFTREPVMIVNRSRRRGRRPCSRKVR